MSINKTALAVTRLLNSFLTFDPRAPGRFGNKFAREKYIDTLLAEVIKTPEDSQALIDMIKTMTILTSGTVKVVRDPSSFERGKDIKTWGEILSPPSMYVMTKLRYPIYKELSRADYELANKLLPKIGSSFLSSDEVRAVFSSTSLSKTQPNLEKHLGGDQSDIEGFDVLYRGLNSMSDDAIYACTIIGSQWDMVRGVSTTHVYETAKGFSDQKSPNRILFEMKNPDRIGFNALNLSVYSRERETILSTKVIIDNYELTLHLEKVGSEYSDNLIRVDATKDLMVARHGTRLLAHLTTEEDVQSVLKRIFNGETLQFTDKKGNQFDCKIAPQSCEMHVHATIQKTKE